MADSDTDSTQTAVPATATSDEGTQPQENHEYSADAVALVDGYLALAFGIAVLAAITAFVIIVLINLCSHRIQLKMVKAVYNTMRVICVFQILAIFLLLVWTEDITNYGIMIAEFVIAVLSIFSREHCAFRWLALIGQLFLIFANLFFMTMIMEKLYCYENDSCELEYSIDILYTLYSQYCISMYFECLGCLIVTYLIASLGFCSNKRFPRQLNLEKYNIERP